MLDPAGERPSFQASCAAVQPHLSSEAFSSSTASLKLAPSSCRATASILVVLPVPGGPCGVQDINQGQGRMLRSGYRDRLCCEVKGVPHHAGPHMQAYCMFSGSKRRALRVQARSTCQQHLAAGPQPHPALLALSCLAKLSQTGECCGERHSGVPPWASYSSDDVPTRSCLACCPLLL